MLLLSEIEQGKRHMTIVRLKDVAEKAGVSIGAVGRVLNGTGASTISVGEKTAKRIQKIADELGYRPNLAARQLRYGKSNIIGIIVHETASDEDLRRIVSIEQFASKAGFQIMVTMLNEQGDRDTQIQKAVTSLRGRGVDGIIALWWELLKADNAIFTKIPVAFIGPKDLMKTRRGVIIDSVEGGRLAAEHLAERGYRRIGCVLAQHEFAEGRLRGAGQVLSANGIPINKDWIIRGTEDHFGDTAFSEESIAELVIKQKVDAIITENDYWATRLYKTISQLRLKIPDDVAIIGYNNQRFCDYMHPSLTSLEEREDEIAQNLIESLKDVPSTEVKRIVRPKLIARKST